MKTTIQINANTLKVERIVKGTEEQISKYYTENNFKDIISIEAQETDLLEQVINTINL